MQVTYRVGRGPVTVAQVEERTLSDGSAVYDVIVFPVGNDYDGIVWCHARSEERAIACADALLAAWMGAI